VRTGDGPGGLGAPLTADELEAAWRVLRDRVPDAMAIELAHLLLAFEANEANGKGALYFNSGRGRAHGWGVTSEVTVHQTLTKGTRRVHTP